MSLSQPQSGTALPRATHGASGVLRERMVCHEKGMVMPWRDPHQHGGISLEPQHTCSCPGGMGIHLWWGPTRPDAEPSFSSLDFPASHEMEKPITGVTMGYYVTVVTIPWVPGAIYHPRPSAGRRERLLQLLRAPSLLTRFRTLWKK